MRNLLSFTVGCLLISNLFFSLAHACPNFSGIYVGDCKSFFLGQDRQDYLIIGVGQNGCDKFIYNEINSQNFYTTNTGSMYEKDNTKLLRRASIIDAESTLLLSETTVVKQNDGSVQKVIEGARTIKILDADTISFSSNSIDVFGGTSTSSISCPSLRRAN